MGNPKVLSAVLMLFVGNLAKFAASAASASMLIPQDFGSLYTEDTSAESPGVGPIDCDE
jgi:hypothetical protein